MENYDVTALREWAPLTEILEKIPNRIQKGLFFNDLSITCVDVLPEFIAFGTDAGIVFWYNRFTEDVQKLRAEVCSPFTCIKIVSTVEYMVAAGSVNGQVTVFQIQKEIPEDLNIVTPLQRLKPIERYTIRDLHKSVVTCCEWSKNGMRLYSGDRHGVVVQTEFDYQALISKSSEILNEAYEIIQLNVSQTYLLISTLYRSIICKREQCDRNDTGTHKWRISQIGKKDRKVLHEFGATFRDTSLSAYKEKSQIICSRPGLRLWIADLNGNVEQTLLFKDTVSSKPIWTIPLLNPSKNNSTATSTASKTLKCLENFGKVLMFSKNYVITFDNYILLILNIEKLRVEGIASGFRKILDVTVCGKEIFILEGPRSVIRISICPEPPSKRAKIIFNPIFPPPLPGAVIRSTSPIEFEPEDDIVINAEECFELPPIEEINLNIPIQTTIDSPTTQKNKLIMEQSQRIVDFEKINEMKFDDSILFRSSKKHKKDTKNVIKNHDNEKKKTLRNDIVEIGQTAVKDDSITFQSVTKKPDIVEGKPSSSSQDHKQENENCSKVINQKIDIMTKPQKMEASFCLKPKITLPDSRPLNTEQDSASIEKIIEESSNSKPQIIEEELKNAIKDTASVLQYPFNAVATTIHEMKPSPRKKMHFINDSEDYTRMEHKIYDRDEEVVDSNLCNELKKNLMIQSDYSNNFTNRSEPESNTIKMIKSLQFVKCDLNEIEQQQYDNVDDKNVSPEFPEIKKFPEFMKIPSLWNDNVEAYNFTSESNTATKSDKKIIKKVDRSDSQTSEEWELIES